MVADMPFTLTATVVPSARYMRVPFMEQFNDCTTPFDAVLYAFRLSQARPPIVISTSLTRPSTARFVPATIKLIGTLSKA